MCLDLAFIYLFDYLSFKASKAATYFLSCCRNPSKEVLLNKRSFLNLNSSCISCDQTRNAVSSFTHTKGILYPGIDGICQVGKSNIFTCLGFYFIQLDFFGTFFQFSVYFVTRNSAAKRLRMNLWAWLLISLAIFFILNIKLPALC